MRSTTRLLLLSATALCLTAQQPSFNRLINVVVSDPRGRFVNGLDQSVFRVVVDGVSQPIGYFLGDDAPISIVIVDESSPVFRSRQTGEEWVVRTFDEALKVLTSSKNPRKTVIIQSGELPQNIPDGIQVRKTDPANLFRTVLEARNGYVIGYTSAQASDDAEVLIEAPRGLPPLKVTRK